MASCVHPFSILTVLKQILYVSATVNTIRKTVSFSNIQSIVYQR